MIRQSEDRGAPLTPQLALRVALIGGFALLMFAIIFFRLWVLQVLTGNQYIQQAQANDARLIPVLAPRGEILDRSGNVMVGSAQVPAVQISSSSLPTPVVPTLDSLSYPAADNVAVYDRLSKVLGISTKPTTCRYKLWIGLHAYEEHARLSPVACLVAQGISTAPFDKVTIKSGVSADVQAYLAERQAQFPGVVSQQVSERQYPLGTVAAQLFGTIGPITQPELKSKQFKGVPQTDLVGQTGLEYQYDQYLRGTDGYEKAKVNAQGQFEGWEKGKAPTAGDNLQLSIDLAVQKTGQQSLAQSIARVPGAEGGAFVAMDPQNGQVYAMGSAPTFNPSIFTKPISNAEWKHLNSAASGYPLINRATQSVGPDGSTFKVITATAALESGIWGVNQTYDDATGHWCFPGTDPSIPSNCKHNSGSQPYGVVNMEKAIMVSDDVFFYNLGYHLNGGATKSGPLQTWAKAFGIGQPTGVDLPAEASGALPSPSYTKYLYEQELMCEHATGPYKGHPKHPRLPDGSGGCGIANTPYWTVGDNVNMAVGQGNVQVSPLQLAVVYSAIANGGTIVTPHVGEDIQSPNGTVLQKIDPGPKRKLNINPTYLDTIRTGLYQAAHSAGGTSADVMSSFPLPVYGKTGTAQYGTAQQIATNTEPDYAWYSCFVPGTATTKPIVVVVWVEKGGFGAAAAAPVARQILSQWFLGKPGPFVTGNSTTL